MASTVRKGAKKARSRAKKSETSFGLSDSIHAFTLIEAIVQLSQDEVRKQRLERSVVTEPSDRLDNRTAIEWLREGRTDEVLELAEEYGHLP